MPPTRIDPASFGLRASPTLYDPSIPDVPRRLVWNCEGLEGTGKTTLALDQPGPIGYIYGDRNFDGPLQRAAALGKKIVAVRLEWVPPRTSDRQRVADSTRPVWKRFREVYLDMLHSKLESLVVDTGGFCWELRRLSKFGALTKILPVMYAEVNTEFINLIHLAKRFDKNVCWIHRLTEEWSPAKKGKVSTPTGRLRRIGMKDMGFEFQLSIRLRREEEMHMPIGPVVGTVNKCTLNRTLIGKEYEGKRLRFARLAVDTLSRFYPNMSPSDWR